MPPKPQKDKKPKKVYTPPKFDPARDAELVANAGKPIIVPFDGHCSSQRSQIFHEETVLALIRAYRANPSMDLMKKIVVECFPLIDSIILSTRFTQYDQLESLRSECATKVMKMLPKYKESEGACFTFFSLGLKRMLFSVAKKFQHQAKNHSDIGEEALENLEGIVYVSPDISEEFMETLDTLEVRDLGPKTVDVLRYYLNVFVSEGMSHPKSKLARSASFLFDISPDTAGFMYDYAIIRLRTHLLDRTPDAFSEIEALRMSVRFTTLPEMAELIGPRNFAKLAKVFAGQTITFPTPKELSGILSDRAWINGEGEETHYTRLSTLSDAFRDKAHETFRLNQDGYNYSGSRQGKASRVGIDGDEQEFVPLERQEPDFIEPEGDDE